MLIFRFKKTERISEALKCRRQNPPFINFAYPAFLNTEWLPAAFG
jgi:hypothetical protein